MMALTVEQIAAAEDDKALFDLLAAELQRLLPEEVREDPEQYFLTLSSMPPGLRAMAGIYFFDVSMTMDSLAWHFGNQNDPRDVGETLSGLRELELTEIAGYFEQTWKFLQPHLEALQSGDFGGKEFGDWLVEIGVQELTDPWDDIIEERSEEGGDLGLLSAWPEYARKYPERCVVGPAQ
jgi:hypothetical protein